MEDTHIEHGHGDNGPAKAVSQLSESMAQTAESHRALVQEMAQFAKDESLRFFNLRLERNGQALEKLQHCSGIPGLLGVQQEWLRDFMQDYMSHNMRVVSALRGLSHKAMTSATEQVAENIDHAQHMASDMAHQVNEQMSNVAQDVNTYTQQTQH